MQFVEMLVVRQVEFAAPIKRQNFFNCIIIICLSYQQIRNWNLVFKKKKKSEILFEDHIQTNLEAFLQVFSYVQHVTLVVRQAICHQFSSLVGTQKKNMFLSHETDVRQKW